MAKAKTLPETCGRLPVTDDGACRQRLIHPDAFECQRCTGVKPSAFVEQPPKASDARTAWVDWAVATGATREYAGALSRDELIAEFGASLARPAEAAEAAATEEAGS